MSLSVEMAVMSTTVMCQAVGLSGVLLLFGVCRCCDLVLFGWLLLVFVVLICFGFVFCFLQRKQQWEVPYLLHAKRSLGGKRKLHQNFSAQILMSSKCFPPPSSCWCCSSYYVGTQDQSKSTTDLVTRLLETEMSMYQGTHQVWRSFSFSPGLGTADLPGG